MNVKSLRSSLEEAKGLANGLVESLGLVIKAIEGALGKMSPTAWPSAYKGLLTAKEDAGKLLKEGEGANNLRVRLVLIKAAVEDAKGRLLKDWEEERKGMERAGEILQELIVGHKSE